MLTVLSGDLFKNAKTPCIIMHGCNARGVMASGFALEVKNRYPWAYNDYAVHQRTMGSVIFSKYPFEPVIANAITQASFGKDPNTQYVSYEAVTSCCRVVAQYAKTASLPIHLPLIGGGLGNGKADILMSIFNDSFEKVEATLWTK